MKYIRNLSIFLLSLLVLCGCSKQNNSSALSESSIANDTSVSSSVTEAESNSAGTVTTTADISSLSAKKKESSENYKYAVEVAGNDGSFVKEGFDTVENIDINRPSSLKGSEVFIGWQDTDVISRLSDGSFEPDEDIVIIPETKDISETENAVFNDTIYARNDAEFIDIPVKIGGDVNFSVLEMEMLFDPAAFEFDTFTYEDADATCNCSEDGKILLSFASTVNINADVDLFCIRFRNKVKQKGEFSVKYNIRDIAAWNEKLTDYINVSSNVVNNRIVMY